LYKLLASPLKKSKIGSFISENVYFRKCEEYHRLFRARAGRRDT
jgi:hypothetical protein